MLFILITRTSLYAQEIDYQNLRLELSQAVSKKTGITSGALFSAVQVVPRHLFLSEERKESAYEDRTIPLGRGRFLPSPSDIMLLLDFSGIVPDERVLIIGNSAGYSAALVNKITPEITIVEINQEELQNIENYFTSEISTNLSTIPENINDKIDLLFIDDLYNLYDSVPFDLIIIEGSLNEIPPVFFGLLNTGGRLTTSLAGDSGFSILFRFEKNGSLIRLFLPDRSSPSF